MNKQDFYTLCTILLLLVLSTLLLSSCRSSAHTVNPVVLERTEHDTVRVKEVARDSIYLHDSIYIHAVGDTIYSERWHTRYSERIQWRDSIVVQRDTIPVEVRTTETVTKYRSSGVLNVLAFVGFMSLVLLVRRIFNR